MLLDYLIMVYQLFINTKLSKMCGLWKTSNKTFIREDKTIESAVPFPAPEKGDNRGLSPFHPRIIIVIGECPLLSPVWKSSPLPQKPLKCLENLTPSASPVTGYRDNKWTHSFNVPSRPLYFRCLSLGVSFLKILPSIIFMIVFIFPVLISYLDS